MLIAFISRHKSLSKSVYMDQKAGKLVHRGPDPKQDKREVVLFKLHGLREKVQ